MLKHLRSPVVLTPVLMSSTVATLALLTNSPTLAQERQGCFMINSGGQLIDLSGICPVATEFAGTQTLGTGDIQVTLRWTTTDDLDLAVTDPSGQIVSYINSSISSGGQLDVDANAGCGGTTSSPIENVFWPPSQAPQGQYNITVNFFSRCTSDSAPVPFEIRLLVQGTTQTLTGTVGEQTPNATFPFSLPSQQ